MTMIFFKCSYAVFAEYFKSATKVLSDVDELTEERVDEVVHGFLEDAKEDLLDKKRWPATLSAYIVSKAALNAYSGILAKEFPSFCVNAVTPGLVKTDMNFNSGMLTVVEGARGPVCWNKKQ